MESWAKAAESFGRVVEGVGPWGALLLAAVVGLCVALALLAHFRGLYRGGRAEDQNLALVDRLIAQVNNLSERDIDLRAQMDRLDLDRDAQRLRAVELQADVLLTRAQLARAIEVLRAVRDGRLPPSAITEADLDGLPT